MLLIFARDGCFVWGRTVEPNTMFLLKRQCKYQYPSLPVRTLRCCKIGWTHFFKVSQLISNSWCQNMVPSELWFCILSVQNEGEKRRVKGGKEEGVGGKGRTRTTSSSQLELELLQRLHVTNSHGVPYFPIFFLVDIAKFTLNFTLFL